MVIFIFSYRKDKRIELTQSIITQLYSYLHCDILHVFSVLLELIYLIISEFNINFHGSNICAFGKVL